mmetsp:Transcript_37260/g.80723  ORF Transcript_37260/g.80723 Transcript_37260/m.80723 type:complete len:153 (-) Transcript_37260:714-1172(-)
MEHPDFHKRDVSSLEGVGAGGAPTPPSQVEKLQGKFKAAKPGQGYGLTETNGAVCTIGGDDYANKPGSTGKPFPIVEAKLIDDAGNDIPPSPDARGELCVKSSLNMLGYWNKPEATRKVMDRHGWFRTGDVAQIDDDGFVFVSRVVGGGDRV